MKSPHHSKKGFTLIEVLIVVVIIGVLAAIALPAFTRYMRNARAASFAADIRTLAGAGNQYALESGYWVEETNAGVYPTELEGYFSEQKYALGSSLGGQWNFEQYGLGDFTSAVGVSGASESDEVFAIVDKRIDDGNLATGIFQKLGDKSYYYVIED